MNAFIKLNRGMLKMPLHWQLWMMLLVAGAWAYDLEAQTLVRVTASGQGEAKSPRWSGDGSTLIFETTRRGFWETWLRPAKRPRYVGKFLKEHY